MALFKRITRTDPEVVFMIHRNDEAADAWVKGGPVVLQADGTRDGVDAVQLNTGAAAKSTLLIGVADSAVVAGEYGKVQVYGMRTDTVIHKCGTASNANGAIGDVFLPMTALDAFSGVAAGAVTGYSPWAVLMETIASSSASGGTTTAKIFLRCM